MYSYFADAKTNNRYMMYYSNLKIQLERIKLALKSGDNNC